MLLYIVPPSLGSSPLARGTHVEIFHTWPDEGLIPARAGNTGCVDGSVRSIGAHPRSRGEHARVTAVCVLPAGSSPLARGTHVYQTWGLPATGLIPARAGNTLSGRR